MNKLRCLILIPLVIVGLVAVACSGGTAAMPTSSEEIPMVEEEVSEKRPVEEVSIECTEVEETLLDAVTEWNHKLAFARNCGDDNWEIYVMKADGSNQTRLTNTEAVDFQPAWSFVGQEIAFASNRAGEGLNIYVMNADGKNPTRLTETTANFNEDPDWSPDSQRLVFWRDDPGHGIYVTDVDGSNEMLLKPWFVEDTTWSPYDEIAFSSRGDNPDEDLDIYVMKADGTNVINLTPNSPGLDYQPAWSPDGEKIAFASEREGNLDIYVMNADGKGEVKNLTKSETSEWHPTWSPNGEYIAFSSYRNGNLDIYRMNNDGTGETRLTTHPADDDQPVWQPRRPGKL